MPTYIPLVDTRTNFGGGQQNCGGGAEVILRAFTSGGGASVPGATGAIPVNWADLADASVRVSVCGVFSASTSPVTINVRVGGTPAIQGTPAGTIVHSFVVPAGANLVLFEELTPLFVKPGAVSYVQVTAVATGTAQVSVHSLTISLVVDDPAKAIALVAYGVYGDSSGAEFENLRWIVDFDQLTTPNVKVSYVSRGFLTLSSTLRHRVRFDGVEVINLLHSPSAPADGVLINATNTVVRPTGMKLVTVSHQATSFNGGATVASIIIAEVA